jgi:endoglucanase
MPGDTHSLRQEPTLRSRWWLPNTRRRPWWLWTVLLVLVPLLVIAGCGLNGNEEGTSSAEAPSPLRFVTAAGAGLVLGGEPTRLKAVNFSNLYHLDGADLLSSQHHSEIDFGRARQLGFNAIRFAFDGDWYVDSPTVFWKWLDQNVTWARHQKMRLILDLHTPIGGSWLNPASNDVRFDLWSKPELRQQNADLWREIATRYKDEPAVAAYDLLNEPVTTDATGQQWKDLARELVAAVRSVDTNHLLVVDGIYGVNGRYGAAGIDQHFLVDDKNVMYDFHFYEPIKYTRQYASWVEGPLKDGGRYPDANVILPTGTEVQLTESRITTPSLPLGTSDWATYDSGIIAITDSKAAAAAPSVTVQGGMQGKAFFDAITVTEYGPDGTEIRQVVNDQLDSKATLDWDEWEFGGDPASPAGFERVAAGYQDNGSLSISDAGATGSIVGWSNDAHLFKVVPGNRYRIQGHMRGENVARSTGAAPVVGLQLDVYAQTPGAAGEGFMARDKAYLAYEMAKHAKFGKDNNVPMSVLEFGLVRQAFEMEGKGGEQWVTDMLALFEENNLSFAYWEYHGTQMGLYLSATGKPSEPNTALQELLTRALR